MKKLLLCASTSSHIKNFHLPYIEAFAARGWEVYTAAADKRLFENTAGCFALSLEKNILSPRNVSAISQARRLLLSERFDAVSLHTTLAAAVVRAALLTMPRRLRPKVFYICHGYLFGENDGASSLKYLIPEKLCAPVTDVLVVMNREDERIARKHRLYKDKLFYADGMGLPEGRFFAPTPEQHIAAKAALGFEEEDRLFVYAAEFSDRKNQSEMISAFARALPDMPRGYLILAGEGAGQNKCRELCASLSLGDRVRFPGFVSDIPQLLCAADGYLSASRIEGMPFSVMEALSSGLPAALSDIKGHRELSETGEAAWLFSSTDELTALIRRIYSLPQQRFRYDLSRYCLTEVLPRISDIYFDENTANERVGAK